MSNALSQKQTKSQIITAIAEETNLSKRRTSCFTFSQIFSGRHLIKNGSGEFTVPEIGELRRVDKPARPPEKKSLYGGNG